MVKRTNWEDLHTRLLAEIVQVSCFHLKKGRKAERQRMRGYLYGLETIERTMVKMEKKKPAFFSPSLKAKGAT